MEKVKISFLGSGTSQGLPVITCRCEVCMSVDSRDKRLRSSVLLQVGGKNLVIDSGPDFRQQMLRSDITRLDAIIFTHGHKDHTAGLDDVRAYNYAMRRPMDVYAENRVMKTIRQEFSYIFEKNKYPGVPELTLHTIDENPFQIDQVQITPIRAMHLRLPVLGFRVGHMAYMTDVKKISEKEKTKLHGLDCFIINGLRKEPHISHFSLSEALSLIEDIKPQRAYITHISHQMGLHRVVEAELPPGVFLAYDGLEIITGK